jgi:hypothetical protein
MILGVSPCGVLEIFVSFPTSPSSLKTEFVCIFYCVSEFGGFIGSSLRFDLSLFDILSISPSWVL